MALPTPACFLGLDLRDQITAIYEALVDASGDDTLTAPDCFKGEDSRQQLTDLYAALLAVGSSTSPFDPDALDFIERAGLTDETQKFVANFDVVALKAASLWDSPKIKVFYPILGETDASHSENLVSPLYPIGWSGGLTHNSAGVTGNGTTGFGNLGVAENVLLGGNTNLHFATYISTQPAADAALRMSIAGANAFVSRYRDGGNNLLSFYMAGSQITFTTGFGAVSQVASGSLRMQSAATQSTAAGADPTLGGGNVNVLRFPSGIQYSNLTHSFFSAGAGLSASELNTLYNIVQTSQLLLGRAV